MAKSFSKIRGGHVLRKWIAKQRAVARDSGAVVAVGFHDRRIDALAQTHEFGAGDIPQRPAFRAAVPDVKAGFKRTMRAVGHRVASPSGVVDLELEIDGAGRSAADTIKRSYLTFEGAEVGERQRRRKAGTPGEDRQLVGHRGPKLIDHIEAKRTK